MPVNLVVAPLQQYLTIGGVSASFISTTRAQDFTPDNLIDFQSVAVSTSEYGRSPQISKPSPA